MKNKALVTNNATCPNNGFSPATGTNHLSLHTVTAHWSLKDQDIFDIECGFANWGITMNGSFHQETDGPNTITVYAAVEYPAGQLNFFTFDGKRSAVIESGCEVFNTPLAIRIPKDTDFKIHTWVDVASTGMVWPYNVACKSALGEAAVPSTSHLGTLSSTVTANSNNGYGPRIVGGTVKTAVPSVVIIGDSIALGDNDSGDSHGNKGYIARALDNHIGHTKLTRSGDAGIWFTACPPPWNYNRRMRNITKFCTHAVVEMGIADVLGAGGITNANDAFSQCTNIWAMLQAAGLKTFQTSITPDTSVAYPAVWNEASQTAFSRESVRVSMNYKIRNNAYGVTVLEMADVAETARDSGIWKTGGLTNEGIHPLAAGAAVLAAAIDLSVFN